MFSFILRFNLLLSVETEHHEVVLNEKFVRECMESYSFSTKAVEANGRHFPVRYFNIVDPLKHSNNLGRSVTQGTLIDQNIKNNTT